MPLIPFSTSNDRRLLEIDRARLFVIMASPTDPAVVAAFDAKVEAAMTAEASAVGSAEILRSDALEFMEDALKRSVEDGVTCGEILLYALSHEAGLGAAFRSVQRIQGSRGRRGFSRSHIKQRVWPKYRSVAHLWAAFKCSADLYRQPAWEPENLWGFLALAERIAEVGEAFVPAGATAPVLDPAATWRVPPGVLNKPWPYGDDWRDQGLYREVEA